MVIIRLSLKGKKKNKHFHIIVTDSRNSRNGKFIERLGFYNNFSKNIKKKFSINKKRLYFWKKKGAQCSLIIKYLIKLYLK